MDRDVSFHDLCRMCINKVVTSQQFGTERFQKESVDAPIQFVTALCEIVGQSPLLLSHCTCTVSSTFSSGTQVSVLYCCLQTPMSQLILQPCSESSQQRASHRRDSSFFLRACTKQCDGHADSRLQYAHNMWSDEECQHPMVQNCGFGLFRMLWIFQPTWLCVVSSAYLLYILGSHAQMCCCFAHQRVTAHVEDSFSLHFQVPEYICLPRC